MPLSKFKKHLGKEGVNVVDEKKVKAGDVGWSSTRRRPCFSRRGPRRTIG